MQRKMRLDMKTIVIALIVLIVAVPAWAIDGTQLLKQIDRNLNPESYELYRKIINIEPSGRKVEYTLFSVKKDWIRSQPYFLRRRARSGRSTLRLGGQHVALYSECGKAGPNYQPSIRHRRRFQQR